MAQTDEIAHSLADLLKPDIPEFRYIRSRTQLRRKGKPFSDDLIINVTSYSGANYAIAFYIGVVHADTEKFIANVEERKVNSYDDLTIFQYSPNVGKQEVLPFSGPVWWWGLPPDGDLGRIGVETRRFVTEFACAYYSHFHDLTAIRDSLVNREGLSINIHPFKRVLAIDALLSDGEHVAWYLSLLQDEINNGYRHDTNQFNSFYKHLSEMNTDMFPSFELVPKRKA